MTPLYIIPARSGSKGIPDKNIRLLGGIPLIGHSIRHARDAGADDAHIIVSTDSDRYAAVAEELGVPTPYRRPEELATDTAGSREVILDAMDYADRLGVAYDCVVLLQPTSPFRESGDILRGLEIFDNEHPDMVVSVTPSVANPYYNLFETDPGTGALTICKGPGTYSRRQDAPPVWEYNGAVYIISPDSLRRYPLGLLPRRLPLEMPRERSLDLDTPEDWARAEELINKGI